MTKVVQNILFLTLTCFEKCIQSYMLLTKRHDVNIFFQDYNSPAVGLFAYVNFVINIGKENCWRNINFGYSNKKIFENPAFKRKKQTLIWRVDNILSFKCLNITLILINDRVEGDTIIHRIFSNVTISLGINVTSFFTVLFMKKYSYGEKNMLTTFSISLF